MEVSLHTRRARLGAAGAGDVARGDTVRSFDTDAPVGCGTPTGLRYSKYRYGILFKYSIDFWRSCAWVTWSW